MTINQAFEILMRAGGIRAARVITENTTNFSKIKIWRMARALRRGVPVAKIIHQKWFYGLRFYTNKYTLDPRPDTETLVSAVISDVNHNNGVHILDLGTGTGCIAVALAKNIPNAHVLAIEKSRGAARVAQKNVRDLNATDSISVKIGDFTKQNIIRQPRFDIIVSNPPYIARGDTRVDIGASHDPKMALYAADNGLAAYIAIAKNARKWITRGGKIYLEIGDGAGRDVRKIFTTAGWKFVRSEMDLAGIDRVLVFSSK